MALQAPIPQRPLNAGLQGSVGKFLNSTRQATTRLGLTPSPTQVTNAPDPIMAQQQQQQALNQRMQKQTDFGSRMTDLTKQAVAVTQQRQSPVQNKVFAQGAKRSYQPSAGRVNNIVGGGSAGARPSNNGSNGRLSPNQLVRVSFAPNASLKPNAARSLDALNAAYRAQFGTNIAITDSYRSFDAQVRVKAQKGRMAATPGTSNHGEGVALDLGGGINNAGSAQNRWLQQNGARFGWVNPNWAKTTKLEPWHWEFVG